MNSLQKEIDKADELYTKFWWDSSGVGSDFQVPVQWPANQYLLGRAKAIGYRSDKRKKKAFDDYIHRHHSPYPRIIVEGSKRSGFKKIDGRGKIGKPKDLVFTFLGYVLDIEFISNSGKVCQIDYKDEKHMPLLGWCRSKNCLVISSQYEKNPFLMLLHSPILTVTERGIEK